MIYNVSQLLKAPVGATQDVDLDDNDRLDLSDTDVELAGPIEGQIRLHRTNQGIYADGKVVAPVRMQCSRCLKDIETTVRFPMREEFYPIIDVNTGAPVQMPENELAFPIDAHHELDMRDAIRQNLVVALPMRPLCREDCAGLCPTCGKDLNDGSCECQPEPEDERFGALRALLDGATADGGTES